MKTETVWIDCADVRLYAEILVPNRFPAPGLLICHGMNAQGFHLLRIYSQLARVACREGFAAMVLDFRGVGKSTGKFDYGFGEQRDVTCALDYLASRPEVNAEQLFLVGHSLGGAVSLYALEGEKRVKGLVLWSVPKNHDYNVKKFMSRAKGRFGLQLFWLLSRVDRLVNVSRLFRLEVYGIKLRLKDVRGKLMKLDECGAISKLENLAVLIVNGEADDIVGPDEAQEVYNAANEPKTLLVMKGANHVFSGKTHELVQKTVEWLKKAERTTSGQ